MNLETNTMQKILFLLLAAAILAFGSCTMTSETDPGGTTARELDYFQLKKYSYESQAQETLLDGYFENALLPALHRAGIKHVGVFKPIDGLNEVGNYIMVLVPYTDLDQLEEIPSILDKDAAYLEAASAFLDAPHDQPPFTRIESFVLRAFSATPHLVLQELSSPSSTKGNQPCSRN